MLEMWRLRRGIDCGLSYFRHLANVVSRLRLGTTGFAMVVVVQFERVDE